MKPFNRSVNKKQRPLWMIILVSIALLSAWVIRGKHDTGAALVTTSKTQNILFGHYIIEGEEDTFTLGQPLSDNRLFAQLSYNAAVCADKPKQTGYKTMALPNITVQAQWYSNKPRSVNDVTVVVNSGLNRLYMLPRLCESWGGPVSLAVYLPLYTNSTSVVEAKKQIGKVHHNMELYDKCTLDIVLLTENTTQEDAWRFPYNSIRNQALSRARTKLVLLLDTDFLISHGLRKQLLHRTIFDWMLEATHSERQLIVIPAFETNSTSMSIKQGTSLAERAIFADKPALKQMYDDLQIVHFAPFFKRGHGPTKYSRWFTTNEFYPVEKYQSGYEPYIIMSRMLAPYFDERFRGYGQDKIMHINHLVQSGFKFMVYPSAFVVHRPHVPSTGYNMTFTGPAYTKEHKPTEEYKKLTAIAEEVMGAIENNTYPKYGVSAVSHCHILNSEERSA